MSKADKAGLALAAGLVQYALCRDHESGQHGEPNWLCALCAGLKLLSLLG